MLLHFGAIRSKSEYGIALRMNRKDWSRGPGLNRGPAVYETAALPTELPRPAVVKQFSTS